MFVNLFNGMTASAQSVLFTPLKLRKWLAGLISALVLAVQTISPAQAQGISLIRDAELESLIREISNPIFVAAGLNPEDVRLHLVNDSSLNAFVAGGQNMFLHTGLLMRVENTGQLAGVVAHETGHIAGGHLARLPGALETASAAMILSYLLGAAAVFAGAGDAGMAILAGGQTIGQRSILAYSRGQESAADQAGLRFLETAGMSGKGFVEFMEILSDQELLSSQRQDPYVRSHPLSRERVNALNDGARKSKYYEASKLASFDRRLELVQAKLHGFLDKPAAVLRDYPPHKKDEAGHYARAVVFHRNAQLGRAVEELNALIKMKPENPYYQELLGQVLFESGKAELAIEPHRRSVELAPDQPLLKMNLAQALVALDDAEADEEAYKMLKATLRLEKDIPLAWHQLAIVHARRGEDGLASLATAERYVLLGAGGHAMTHAKRAYDQLPKGSPGWLRAGDILALIEQASQRR